MHGTDPSGTGGTAVKRRATAEPADRAAAILQGFDVAGFRCRLVDWFRHQQRDLPWRRDRDPYKIWVSEVMLQQTRVETALPYFLRFVERFPTVEALAAAEEADVLKLWEGLGYYSRARNLLRGARQVMEEFGGVLPDDPEELARIKGIGPYTAGAILSIAYGRPVPAVDGNVLRVLSRLLLVEEDVQKPGTRRLFTQLAAALVCPDDPSAFNQGLMELGARVHAARAEMPPVPGARRLSRLRRRPGTGTSGKREAEGHPHGGHGGGGGVARRGRLRLPAQKVACWADCGPFPTASVARMRRGKRLRRASCANGMGWPSP